MITIKDPIYGLIHLDKDFNQVINHPLFIRLRYIKQLSLAYLVYPGATHTRYQHSIGVYGLTDKFFRIYSNIQDDIDSIKMYALLHDIGHIAFSHDSESVLAIMDREWEYTYEKRSVKVDSMYSHERFGEKITNIITEDLNLNYNIKDYEIISAEVGFDRLDYLVRDAYYTGTTYGIVDEYVLDLITYKPGGKIEFEAKEEKVKRTVESILIARYLMFNNVYHHKTLIKAAAILRKLLYLALEKGLITFQELADGGDEAVLWKLVNSEDYNIRELARDIWYRRLYKYEIIETPEKMRKEEIVEILESENRFVYWGKSKKVNEKFRKHLDNSEFIYLINQLSKDKYILIENKG